MSLARTAIRHGVRDLLVGKTMAGDRVVTSWRETHLEGALPKLAVFVLSDAAEARDESPPTYWRELEVIVSGATYDQVGLPVEDGLELFAHQVEEAVAPWMHLPAVPVDIAAATDRTYLGDLELEYSDDGKRLVGEFRQSFHLSYLQEVAEGAEPALLAYLESVYTDWRLAEHPSDEPHAEDLTTV